jgi:hypothetical protein
MDRNKIREEIIEKIKLSSLNENEASGFKVKLFKDSRSNPYRKYCIVEFKENTFTRYKLVEVK